MHPALILAVSLTATCKAVADYTVSMYNEQAPLRERQVLQEWRNMVNLPSIAVKDNVAFDSFQLNIAPAVSGDDSECPSHGLELLY